VTPPQVPPVDPGNRKDARNWGQQLVKTAESMSVAGLVVANGHLP
jgi:hypothetical protein